MKIATIKITERKKNKSSEKEAFKIPEKIKII
jgi:hypothetical protein